MKSQQAVRRSLAVVALLVVPALCRAEPPAFRLRVEPVHAWRPPFGLDRLGGPVVAVVEATAKPAPGDYQLTTLHDGQVLSRSPVKFPEAAPFLVRTECAGNVDAIALNSGSKELVRIPVQHRGFEADATARPESVVNPVDLGTILVPNGWLLLGPKQSATVEVAAINRGTSLSRVVIRAWYESRPGEVSTGTFPLPNFGPLRMQLPVRTVPPLAPRDTLGVSVNTDQGDVLYQKAIPVLYVASPPRRPAFGATSEKLRYDPPISVRDPKTGTFSTLPYSAGFKPQLNDVVVCLPNGARYVFWRGSSYIPFWAGQYNTGACYEWAEVVSRMPGAVDCVEPLMDKELRYGKVDIVESTDSRIHVRWSYQSTDLHYQVWGDAAVEDYYFYPDGYGTRVLSLTADPKNEYELSEFIVLTPMATYPFSVLPRNLVDALFLDGRKQAFQTPGPAGEPASAPPRDGNAIYRLRLNTQERLAAIYFNPNEPHLPPVVFGPFFEAGQIVTPCYWGSHWPLARGNATGYRIDDRVALTPCHNSVMSWGGTRPAPIHSEPVVTKDTLGRTRPLLARRWAWLIGMSDEPDARLLERARSFATPPTFTVRGGHRVGDGYAQERRALTLAAEGRDVTVAITPGPPCVNPVLEVADAPAGTISVTLAGHSLDAKHHRWDGHTLWLDATLTQPTELRLSFAGP